MGSTDNPGDSNKRSSERFDKEARTFFYFHYDLKTKLNVENIIQKEDPAATFPQKYPACSKNVSAEGLCFTSFHRLHGGDALHLDMFIDEDVEPIHMEGEVRWCQASFPGYEKIGLFDTGVRLLSIEGKPVPESIHFDEQYKIIWSEVLDTILGNIREMARHKKSS